MTFQPQPRDIDWDIEEQHLDEAEFMLQVWDAALEAPDYTLTEIATGPERRLLAHVDALAIGESVVLEHMLLPTIEDPHAGSQSQVKRSLSRTRIQPGLRRVSEMLSLPVRPASKGEMR